MKIKIPKNINRTDIIVTMQEWIIGDRAERNRAILSRKLIDGLTFEEVAEEFQMSDRQIKTIVYKGCNIIFSHIPKE